MSKYDAQDIELLGEIFIFQRPKFLDGVIAADFMAVKVGDVGYWKAYPHQAMNLPGDVVESAMAGSMFGWNCPAARRAVEYAKGGAA